VVSDVVMGFIESLVGTAFVTELFRTGLQATGGL
jgi:hypothetical protein